MRVDHFVDRAAPGIFGRHPDALLAIGRGLCLAIALLALMALMALML